MFITDFIKDTFVRRLEPNSEKISIDEVTISEGTKEPKTKRSKGGVTINKKVVGVVILQINRVLILILLISFILICLYPFIKPNEKVPETITNIFYVTIGYFGSALGTFIEKSTK